MTPITSNPKIKNNHPCYDPFMKCYKIEWRQDGEDYTKYVDNYKAGTEWLKTTFPEWFKKHFTSEAKTF